MNDVDALDSLKSLGFEWPSPTYLFGILVFSVIGYGAFRYGRKTGHPRTMWLGVGLMLYPYVVSATWLLYVVGIALCIGIWLDRG